MRETTTLEKLTTSAINVIIVLIIYAPFYFIIQNSLTKKLTIITIFFIYNQVFIFTKSKKCLGMRIMKTKYKTIPTNFQYTIYTTLYAVSFTTLFFKIFYPLDIFLANMLFLQLPTVILKKTTLHGYLSGNITTIKSET